MELPCWQPWSPLAGGTVEVAKHVLTQADGAVRAHFIAPNLKTIRTGHGREPHYAARPHYLWAVDTPQRLQANVDCVQVLPELTLPLLAASPDIWYHSDIALTRQPRRARRLVEGLEASFLTVSSPGRTALHLTCCHERTASR